MRVASLASVNYFGVDAETLLSAVACVDMVESMSEEEVFLAELSLSLSDDEGKAAEGQP